MLTVHTIGYEGSNLEPFIHTLLANQVRHLIDVRDRPISRKPGFSKGQLRVATEKSGIRYTHLQSLGDPKPGREAMREGRYEDFQRIYTNHLNTEAARIAVREALYIAKQHQTALMCFEKDPRTCHRSLVVERMATVERLSVIHLQVAPMVVQDRRDASEAGVVPVG